MSLSQETPIETTDAKPRLLLRGRSKSVLEAKDVTIDISQPVNVDAEQKSPVVTVDVMSAAAASRLTALQEMGFSFEQASAAVAASTTLQEAVEFCILNAATANDHFFAEDAVWGVDSCTICGKALVEHPMGSANDQDSKLPDHAPPFRKQTSKILARPDRFPRHAIVDNQTELCIICAEDLSPQDFHRLPCGHSFCLNCLDRYFTERICDGKVSDAALACPTPKCGTVIPREQIEQTVDADILSKFHRFLKEAEIRANPLAKYCPAPRCDNVLYRKRADQMRVDCEKCGFSMCFQCGQAYHGSRSCDKVQEDNVMKWAAENGTQLQKCPNCKVQIEKTEGCNHMTCKCGYQFCWLCRGKYSDNHFAAYNPLGCPAMQYGVGRLGCLGRNCVRLGIILLYLLAIPIVLLMCVFAPFVCFCSATQQCDRVVGLYVGIFMTLCVCWEHDD